MATLGISYIPRPRARLALRVLGPVDGEPWLFLHGGPGSGSHPAQAHAFDLSRQRVFLLDQRGAGHSRPRGATPGNHTGALLDDLEALRLKTGVARWNVLAGSWGATLALAYAGRHPGAVTRLVLRGAFAARWREVGALLRQPTLSRERHQLLPGRAADRVTLAPLLHRAMKLLHRGTVGDTAQQLLKLWSRLEQAAALRGMKRSLLESRRQQQTTLACRQAPQIVAMQRGARRQAAGYRQAMGGRSLKPLWQKYSVQLQYLKHRCRLHPAQLDVAVARLAAHGVDCDWLHGRFDKVCRPANSQAWAGRQGQPAHLVCAGHLSSEPALADALVAAVRHARK